MVVAGTPPEGASDVMAVLESDPHTQELRRMGERRGTVADRLRGWCAALH